MRTLSFAALALAVGPLAAQVDRDDFSYPNGAVVPGWTQQRGTWQVLNGRISATSGALWAYITKDGLAATDSVMDGEFFYSTATTVQFAGFTSRHPGTNLDSNLLMVKVQNNGGAADFDRCFAYERAIGASTFVDIAGGTLQCYGRMITLDGECWMELDADQDGIYELETPHKAVTAVFGSGLVGMCAYQTSEMDNFEYFDGVLVPQPGAAPIIGTTYNLALDVPSANVPWLGVLSLGNAGVPLDAPRALPVSLDALFIASLGVFVGQTDAAGKATFGIPIPNNPSLVGLGVYAGAVTIDTALPFAVGHIANESFFRIQ
ncbi:MAG: hypothetical protein R3F56_03325 [Planctomycetota bacterium]